MTPYELAGQYLSPYKLRNEQIIPRYCPFCNGGEHHDKETFALNSQTGAYNCQRGSCGAKGGFRQLAEHFGVEPDTGYGAPKTQKQYKRPDVKVHPRTDAAEHYLSLRKISRQTMDKYCVGCDSSGNIMFPYMRDDRIVFIKYRPARKLKDGERKAWREAATEPILYGMDLCDKQKPLVICEGEIDALSLSEAGVSNAVSVPSGCSDMDWIDNCWEWLEGFGKIILCGDMDQPGREMVRQLSQRLGVWRCYTVTLPEGHKDANETLYRDGPEVLRGAVEGAREAKVVGIIRLADVKPEDALSVESASSGIIHLDSKTGGFLMGELSVWTGKRGGGKSTLVGQTLLDGIDQGYRVCAYSGELRASRFQNWIDSQAAGPNHVKMLFSQRRGKDVPVVPIEIRNKIHDWYRDAFYIYDNGIIGTTEEASILEVFELAARRYGCRIFMVDNLMTSRYKVERERDRWAAQGVFVGELAAFAKQYNVHVHLVAHPRKEDKTNQGRDLDGDDVAGSSEITDRADNVFAIRRVPDKLTELKILKNREDGAQYGNPIGLEYCPLSRRLYPPSEKGKEYGWEIPEWVRGFDRAELPLLPKAATR